MSNLGISIGSLWKIVESRNRNEFINCIKNLNLHFDAIELLFAEKDLPYLDISENIDWINKFKYKSFHHGPYKKCNKKIIDNIFDKINFDGVVKHIDHTIDYDSNNILIENLENKKLDDPEIYMNNNICCDLSHALSHSMSYLIDFIATYHKNIKQFHFSNCINGECHQMFYQDKNNRLKEIRFLLEDFNLIDKPLIMEYIFNSKEELINEYNYINDILFK